MDKQLIASSRASATSLRYESKRIADIATFLEQMADAIEQSKRVAAEMGTAVRAEVPAEADPAKVLSTCSAQVEGQPDSAGDVSG